MALTKQLRPAEEISVLAEEQSVYQSSPIRSPRLVGWPLRIFVWLIDSWLFLPIRALLERANKIPQTLAETDIPESPLFVPVHLSADVCADVKTSQPLGPAEMAALAFDLPGLVCAAKSPNQKTGQTMWTAAELSKAYSCGRQTPSAVAARLLARIKTLQDMAIFIACDAQDVLQQAAESSLRYQRQSPLSPLDGVPYAVKDMLDALPYETTCGTTYMSSQYQVQQDHPMVAAMRATGAILLGKTNMHELGVSPIGLNMHFGIPCNPHNPSCFAGGSSSGSAAAVAAGLCPFAIGNDGGGSIRVPAACCGVVGLKPTWGRDSIVGGPRGVKSLVSTGPIAATVADAAIMYAVTGNAGTKHLGPVPPVRLPKKLADGTERDPMHGQRLGIFWDWFNDAAPEVVDTCKAAVNSLCAKGAEVVPISIPELDAARVAHVYTFGSEAASCHMQELQTPSLRRQMAADVRVTLGISQSFKAQQFVQGQRIRSRMVTYMEKAFQEVDFIVTPTIPDAAPPIQPDVHQAGESDLSTVGWLMRFVFLSNFTGHPAISVPVGHTTQGMPIGLQLIGRPWAEAELLFAGSVAQQAQKLCIAPPTQYFCPLVESH
ncbi:hypothetical protein ABBQ38_008292 [Trebouxia sp. C0009 RCD-2024]